MEDLKRYIRQRMAMLNASSFDFKGLFEIIHDQGDRVFCEYLEDYQVTKITYPVFRDYCLKTAAYLSGRIGDEKGSFVGLYSENSPHFLAAFWALLMLGYKPLLFNCRLPADVNRRVARAMNARTVVSAVDDPLKDGTPTVRISAQMPLDREILSLSPFTPDVWGDEIALTSTATSMKIKICVYTGRDFTCQMLNAQDVLNRNRMIKKHTDGCLKQLAFLPFYHIFGLTAVYLWFSAFGRTFVFLRDYASDTIVKTVRRHGVTHIFAVPLLWNTVAREIKKELAGLPEKKRRRAENAMRLSLAVQNLFPQAGQRFARRIFKEVAARLFGKSVRFMISGGGYISDEALYMLNAVGYPLYNGYGSTEIGITSVELRSRPKYRILGTVGTPLATVEYKTEGGVLFVRGRTTCSRIVYADGTSVTVAKDGWFDTGDAAEKDRKGYYRIRGRMDDVWVGENGEKIDPDLIEKKLLLTNVRNFSVLDLDGKLTLIFAVGKNETELKKKAIAGEIAGALDTLDRNGYRIQAVYFTTDPMAPENAIKVSRAQLKKQIGNGAVVLRPYEQMKDLENLSEKELSADTLAAVRKVFSEVLGCEESAVGDDMHFIFDLGGTSLDYCTVLMKLQNSFGIGFSFEKRSCATARDFAQYIMENCSGGQKK
ncbi:MAG: non-ribosomal peptide synthetase [Clostridia bacterium]|nr:non-ribosomal peptide synthetase [Clostridia bacterium]